jgi:hypothetical protein
MKKLIVLLLFPLVSFSQTYEDIISIDSKEQFIRIGIENDYEVIENNNNSVKLALEPRKNKKKETIAKGFANYEDYKELFIAVDFQFHRKNLIQKSKYDKIFSFVKKNLKFKEVSDDASWYTLDEKRELGFGLDGNWCVVFLYTDY